MTYEERKKKYCENCFKAYPSCAYKSRNLEDKCGVLENIMNGWELGYQDAVEKALDFFGSNYNSLVDGGVIGVFDDKEKMIEEFEEFMKGE